MSPLSQISPEICIKYLSSNNIMETIQVHKQAFRGYLNTQLGDAYLKAFISWFIDEEKGIVIGAFDDGGNLVGYIMGAPVGYKQELDKHIMSAALLGALTHFWLFLNPRFLSAVFSRVGLGRDLSLQTPQLSFPVMSLVAIGVIPPSRGKNVGEALMMAFEEQSLKRHMNGLRLSVYPKNIAARELYEKVNWSPHRETRNPNHAMYYYKRLLDPAS